MEDAFSLAPSPLVYFGAGKISVLPSVVKTFGSRVLLVTGAKSFTASRHYQNLLKEFNSQAISIEHLSVSVEPTPGIVDEAVKKTMPFGPAVIVAVGGGSCPGCRKSHRGYASFG